MDVPDSPQEFYEVFFPAQFLANRAAFPRVPRTPAATFVVEGVGAWSFHIAGDELVVTRGMHPDTRMQVVFNQADFEGVVVQRARDELRTKGRVSKASLGPFVLLLSLHEKLDVLDGMRNDALLFLVLNAGRQHKMMIVPGAGTPPARARTVLQLDLKDAVALFNGEANGMALFMTRRMKIKGDLQFALKANALLA